MTTIKAKQNTLPDVSRALTAGCRIAAGRIPKKSVRIDETSYVSERKTEGAARRNRKYSD